MSRLRDEDRLAIAGRYFLDLSEAQIADLLGCARGTVKSRLARTLVRLRTRLAARDVAALLVALGLLALGLLAWAPAREAIATRLGLRGVTITHVDEAPTPVAVAGSTLGLGEPVPNDEAARQLGRPLRLPSALGPPQAYFGAPGEAALFYATGGGLLLTEFNALYERQFIGKGLPPRTRIQEVTVAGQPALWIDGAPHLFFPSPNGLVRDASPRLAGNTLLWAGDGMTLRIESALTLAEVLPIAESVGTD